MFGLFIFTDIICAFILQLHYLYLKICATKASTVFCLQLWLWHMVLIAPWHVTLPGPGIEPVSPALTGRFLTTGKSSKHYYTLTSVFSFT